MHYADVFLKSSLYNRGLALVGNAEFHFLGDAAYPVQPQLLTPHRDHRNLHPAQVSCNIAACIKVAGHRVSLWCLEEKFPKIEVGHQHYGRGCNKWNNHVSVFCTISAPQTTTFKIRMLCLRGMTHVLTLKLRRSLECRAKMHIHSQGNAILSPIPFTFKE